MDLDRAKAICNVADKLIHSAKVEVKFMEVCDASEVSEFFTQRPVLPPAGGFEALRPRKVNGRA